MQLEKISQEHLIKLQAALQDIPNITANTIERFYLAQDGNIQEAEKNIRCDFEWRKVIKPHELVLPDCKDPKAPSYIKEHEAEVLNDVRDNRGHPIILVRCSKHDGNLQDDKFKEFIIVLIETALKRGSRVSILFDVYGIGWRNIDFNIIRYSADMLSSHYPERLSYCLVLRPPLLFSYVFKISKLFLGHRTLARIHLIKCRDKLMDFIADIDDLPEDVSFVKSNNTVTITRSSSDFL
ncbi:hypothetical protein ACOME3_000634 [Neoechinorhynchus agilis]